MKRKLLMLITLFVTTAGFLMAQIRVQGTVVDEAGEPVIGVTVQVKGTTHGTNTNVNGKFTVSAPSDGVLVFSYVGMITQEVKVKPSLRVVMKEDVQMLDDVVVLGYGSGRKITTVTGAVAKVSSKSLEHKPVSNVMESLQGKIAGLQVLTSSGEPTAVSSLKIHGIGSLGAGNAPLYILDGAPVSQGALLSMNQDDFESIQVMKDASATSIYGARAANGVIYITSKKGVRGEKGRMVVNMEYGISQLAKKDYMDPMNSAEILEYQLKNKLISQKVYDEHKATGIDTKWRDYLFKDNAPLRKLNVAFMGGGKNNSYYLSAGYHDQDGITIGSFFEKYTMRTNIEAQINKWLKVGFNVSGAYDERESFYGGHGMSTSMRSVVGSYYLLPYYTPYDEDGNVKDYIDGVNMASTEYVLSKSPEKNRNFQANGVGFIEIKPFKGLTLKSQYGLDWYHYRETGKSLPSADFNKGIGSRSESFYAGTTQNITNTIEYAFSVNNDHRVTLLAGQEGVKYQYEEFGVSLYGMTDDRLMLFGAGGTGDNLRKPWQSKSEYRYLSFFGRTSYAYSNKYFLDVTLRNDASSRFGKNNRNATFYSLGAMWNITNEEFMKSQKIFNSLRLKASYGTTGNSSIGNYAHLALLGTTNYMEEPGWAVSTPGNKNLRWEKQRNFNVGISAAVLNSRLRMEIDYYIRSTENMLMSVPQPYSSGVGSLNENVGTMENKGIDLMVDFDFVKTRDFLFNFRKTFNYNHNKIKKLFYGLDEWIIPNTGVSYRVGYPIEFYYPKWIGVDPDDGKQMWEIPGTNETTKKYSKSDLEQPLGKWRYPPYTGGFSLSGSWRKGLFFQADFAYVLGKWMINNDRAFVENRTPGHNLSRRVLNEWQKPGDITDIPKFGEKMQFDSHLLENASFLRLKSLSVGYQLPKSLLEQTGFVNGVKIMFSARNVFTLTKYSGVDPEVDSNLTYGRLPNTRQFLTTLQLTL